MTVKRRFFKRGAMIGGNHNRSRAAEPAELHHQSPEAADLSPDDELLSTSSSSSSSSSRSSEEDLLINDPHSPIRDPQQQPIQQQQQQPTQQQPPAASGRQSPLSPFKATGCIAKILNDTTLWGPLGRPVPSHTDITATFHDVQRSFMKRISITNITIRFAMQFRTNFGESIRIVGSIPMLGNWSATRAPQMTWTEGDIWVLDLPVPIAFHRDHGRADSILQSEPDPMLLQFEYKYVITNATGTSGNDESGAEQTVSVYRWEEGANHQFAISESAVVEKMNTCPCTIWDLWRAC